MVALAKEFTLSQDKLTAAVRQRYRVHPQTQINLLPCELRQENYPKNLGGNTDTTDLGGQYETKVINDGDIAYITGEPDMPKLKAEFKGLSSDVIVEWKLEIKSERSERGTKDDRVYPSDGNFKSLPGNQAWDIYQELAGDFVGGECTLTYKVFGTEGTIEFKIRGKNPKDADAKTHIQANQGTYRFAWAMSQHESRQGSQRVYNHFNSGGSTKELPNLGPPDGWGIAQLDQPLGVSADTDEVYSWHENVVKFKAELQEKDLFAQSYFNKVQQIYPNQWEAPPSSWTRQGTNTSMTATEAAVVQLYNGASIILWVKNNQVVSSGTSGAVAYLSSWRFHPNNASGQRWEFVPNQNNYLYKVIHDEVEGNLGTQE